MTTPARTRSGHFGDVTGAFADLGTFLPLVVGILAIRDFDATGLLVGFGLFAFATAAFYRLPIPVQPMKAIAAIVIVGALTPEQTMASGLIIGAILIALAAAGIIGRIARVVPVSVIMGIQMAVGIQLAYMGVGHVLSDPAWGLAALAVLAACYMTLFRHAAGLAVIVAATAFTLMLHPEAANVSAPGFYLPALAWPSLHDFEVAALVAVVPQLALTLSNAVLATAAIAADRFPEAPARANVTRLAFGSGLFNLVLAPFGAMPMCHGSGGLIAQYGFGARTWRAPALFGAACLVLGVGFGPAARDILVLVPLAAVGALLVVAGAEMALSRKILEIKPSCRVVVVGTAIACVASNVAVGLVIGIGLEMLRTLYVRHMARHSGML